MIKGSVSSEVLGGGIYIMWFCATNETNRLYPSHSRKSWINKWKYRIVALSKSAFAWFLEDLKACNITNLAKGITTNYKLLIRQVLHLFVKSIALTRKIFHFEGFWHITLRITPFRSFFSKRISMQSLNERRCTHVNIEWSLGPSLSSKKG